MLPEQELLARAKKPAEEALRLHPFYRGKVQMMPKCPIQEFQDFAIWYTPGRGRPVPRHPAGPGTGLRVHQRANSIAIVTDGTRVLGLGDIGPEAGLPVMEGKALLFKYLGGVDAVPSAWAPRTPRSSSAPCKLLEPAFGGINLEDIAQPKCFRILDALREEMRSPSGTTTSRAPPPSSSPASSTPSRWSARTLGRVKIALIGMGAANVATYRLLRAYGVEPGRHRRLRQQGHPAQGPRRTSRRSNRSSPTSGGSAATPTPRRIAAASRRRCGGPTSASRSRNPARISSPRMGAADGQGRHRLCLRQPRARDLAVGGEGGGGARRRHRPQRLPQPGQQLARLPRHLPRARWTCAPARSPTRWPSPPLTSSPARRGTRHS